MAKRRDLEIATILVHSHKHSISLTEYILFSQPLLEAAKRRDLEMLVANADLRATLPSGSLGYMPGCIGREYQRIGGRVR